MYLLYMFKNVPCLFPPHAKMDHYTISSGRNKNVTPPNRQTLRQTLRGTGAEKAFWQPKTSPKQLPKQGGAMKMSTEERKFGKREKREKENSHNFGQNAFALVGVGTFFMPSFNACFASSTSWLVGIFTGSGRPGGSKGLSSQSTSRSSGCATVGGIWGGGGGGWDPLDESKSSSSELSESDIETSVGATGAGGCSHLPHFLRWAWQEKSRNPKFISYMIAQVSTIIIQTADKICLK